MPWWRCFSWTQVICLPNAYSFLTLCLQTLLLVSSPLSNALRFALLSRRTDLASSFVLEHEKILSRAPQFQAVSFIVYWPPPSFFECSPFPLSRTPIDGSLPCKAIVIIVFSPYGSLPSLYLMKCKGKVLLNMLVSPFSDASCPSRFSVGEPFLSLLGLGLPSKPCCPTFRQPFFFPSPDSSAGSWFNN